MTEYSTARTGQQSMIRKAIVLVTLVLTAVSGFAFAQNTYPNKPITVLVWSSAGGKADSITRAITPLLAKNLGTDVVVKNMVGGGGMLAVNHLAASPADGYTLLTASPTLAALYSAPGARFTEKDIQPICITSTVPFTIIVPADSPFKTLKDFIQYAKSHPGELRIGGPFAIGSHRVHWVQFQKAAGIKTTWVPFDGSKEADLAVAGGKVDAGTSTNPSDIKNLIKAGKIRALAESGTHQIAGIDAPTYKQEGIDFSLLLWTALVTKSGLPQADLQKLTNACFAAMRTDQWNTVSKRFDTEPSFMEPPAIEKMIASEAETAAEIRKSLTNQ